MEICHMSRAAIQACKREACLSASCGKEQHAGLQPKSRSSLALQKLWVLRSRCPDSLQLGTCKCNQEHSVRHAPETHGVADVQFGFGNEVNAPGIHQLVAWH